MTGATYARSTGGEDEEPDLESSGVHSLSVGTKLRLPKVKANKAGYGGGPGTLTREEYRAQTRTQHFSHGTIEGKD